MLEWAAQNYPPPRTTTADWLHKATDRNVSWLGHTLHHYSILIATCVVFISRSHETKELCKDGEVLKHHIGSGNIRNV